MTKLLKIINNKQNVHNIPSIKINNKYYADNILLFFLNLGNFSSTLYFLINK